MRNIILVKHARPQVVEDVPSTRWRLSDEGRRKAELLAGRLAAYDVLRIFTSDELKAVETGEILARILDRPAAVAAGLHEHDRANVPLMQPREFISHMAHFFKHPDEPVLGNETANEAADRILDAVDDLVAANPEGNLAVVTHGTVLSLLICEYADHDPFKLWRRLEQPSFAVFRVPGWELGELVERI